ncbi:hypothetical protein HBB16_18070 [Pseudonocardia sp. MCCB 268]|nr:hypothetical protein [Pseudonocardia cytotoxica]
MPGALLTTCAPHPSPEGRAPSARRPAAPVTALAGSGPHAGRGCGRRCRRPARCWPGGEAERRHRREGRWWNCSRSCPGPSWTPSSPRRSGDRFRARVEVHARP